MYRFSIITYNFNNEVNIIKHLSSLINIDHNDYEIILIDDFSTDNSLDLVTNKLKIRNNIRILSNKYSKGVFNCLNIGLEQSKGKYILFTNSGFILNSNILKTIDLNIVENDIIPDLIEYKITNNTKNNYMNMIVSRNVVNQLGYFDTFDMYSDWDYKFRIMKIYAPFYINLVLGEQIDYRIDDHRNINNIYFKNKFSKLDDRYYIPKDNWIKMIDFELRPEIYSNLDVIIDENNGNIICSQYVKVYNDSIYKVMNNDNKCEITISKDNNIITILNGQVGLLKGLYNIKYKLVDNKVIKFEPLYFVDLN